MNWRQLDADVRFGAAVVLCLLMTAVDFVSYFMSMLSDGVLSATLLIILWGGLKKEREAQKREDNS